MPPTKRRISISPDRHVVRALEKLAKLRGEPVASVSLDLLERALELDEDVHFSRIADERIENDEPRVGHDRAWS